MPKLSFKQQVIIGSVITLIFVFAASISAFLSITQLQKSSQWVNHSNLVIQNIEHAQTNLLVAESNVRTYILTEKPFYLNEYIKYGDLTKPKLAELKTLVNDNDDRKKIIDSLASYSDLKLNEMNIILDIYKDKGKEAATSHIKNSNSEYYKQRFIDISNQFKREEFNLLDQRKRKNEIDIRNTGIILAISSISILFMVSFLISYIRKSFNKLKENEERILLSNKELKDLSNRNKHQNWLLTCANEINESMRGQQKLKELSNNLIAKICTLIKSEIGVIYILDERQKKLNLTGTYASTAKNKNSILIGEGLIGQTAIDQKQKFIKDIPENYIKISSAFGEITPSYLFILPIIHEKQTIGVIELGFLSKPDEKNLDLIHLISENISVAYKSVMAHTKLQQLFEQTQQQAEELISQQEELRATNDELSMKTEALQASEEELRVQQEELQQAHTELIEKAQQLEVQNSAIIAAKEAIIAKAEELEQSSKYKSEFLANMSHELRTPLNSILILARILKDNKVNTLNDDQIKYAGVILNAGTDLLNLINDILDLTKIESGNVDLNIEDIELKSIEDNIYSLFDEVAGLKKIKFNVILDENLPQIIQTDQIRLEQILKNLLSNAFKFTPESGEIELKIGTVNSDLYNSEWSDNRELPKIYFSVKDSGIGIQKNKQQIIFEAFKQEDGSTSRKYGGTGLGLSICRELANLLGGNILLESEIGQGSVFTLLVPQQLVEGVQNLKSEIPIPTLESVTQKQALIPFNSRNGNKLLIIEDDLNFAEILREYAVEKGFEPILAFDGEEGLKLATEQLPNAIILDVKLPLKDGWSVLKSLKENPKTAQIPVHMMSALEDEKSKASTEGAIGFLKKPVDFKKLEDAFNLLFNKSEVNLKRILIIDDEINQNSNLSEQLSHNGIKVSLANNGKEALELLDSQKFDCIILELKLSDMSGFDLLDKIKASETTSQIPVIINTAMELDKSQSSKIIQYSDAMVLKTSKSNDRLLDEVSLFINKIKENNSAFNQNYKDLDTPTQLIPIEKKAFQNKTVLIADDDMRNIFALSTVLQEYDLHIEIATNGKEAIHQLKSNSSIDLVLMDIMMPEMDGFEAIKHIRRNKDFQKLPIIALTAKAMKNDREKFIAAGANDYISKPVDIDKLIGLLRVWLN